MILSIVDGVHLSIKGYWVWAKAVRNLIDKDAARLAYVASKKAQNMEEDEEEDEEEENEGLSDTDTLVKIGTQQD
jgi:hypothetical protein